MKVRKTVLFAICALIVISLFAANIALAADKEPNAFVKFVRKIFGYPANVAEKSVEVVANTTEKGVETVATTVKTTGEVVTGDIEKTKDLVVEPVKGTVDTAYTAVEGTVTMPVEAAKATESEVEGSKTEATQ